MTFLREGTLCYQKKKCLIVDYGHNASWSTRSDVGVVIWERVALGEVDVGVGNCYFDDGDVLVGFGLAEVIPVTYQVVEGMPCGWVWRVLCLKNCSQNHNALQ